MRINWKFVVRVLISLLVSGVFIVFSLRDTDVKSVLAAVAAADIRPVLGYLAALLAVHVVKTVRWGLLLKPLGPIRFKRLNAASAVGFMMMVVLPLRLGELARPLLVAQPTAEGEMRLPRSGCLATVLVERVVDSIAIGVLGIITLHVLAPVGQYADLARHGALVVTVGFSCLCLCLVAAFFMQERAAEIVRRLVTPVSPGLARKLVRLLLGFVRGLHLGSASRVAGFLVLTVVYWGLHVWGFWVVAGAFGLEISLLMASAVLAFQVVGIMIPAGPGMVGTSQFFTQLGVSVCLPGLIADPGAAARVAGYANTIWLLQFGQQALTGLVFLGLGHISLGAIFTPWEDEPEAAPEKAPAPEQPS